MSALPPESGRITDIGGRLRCASMYGPAARYKMASKINERESCINVSGL
jgi:hypothetical protein